MAVWKFFLKHRIFFTLITYNPICGELELRFIDNTLVCNQICFTCN